MEGVEMNCKVNLEDHDYREPSIEDILYLKSLNELRKTINPVKKLYDTSFEDYVLDILDHKKCVKCGDRIERFL